MGIREAEVPAISSELIDSTAFQNTSTKVSPAFGALHLNRTQVLSLAIRVGQLSDKQPFRESIARRRDYAIYPLNCDS
jgi:hypothetical protein